MKITNLVNRIASFSNSYPDKWLLEEVKQVNFFIGPNNSGKSRKLRELFSIDKSKLIIDSDLLSVKQVFCEWRNMDRTQTPLWTFINQYGGINWENFVEETEKLKDVPLDIENIAEKCAAPYRRSYSSRLVEDIHKVLVQYVTQKYADDYSKLTNIKNIDWLSLYIPTTRGLRHIHESDLYRERTISDYFKTNTSGNIFTGHSLYSELQRHLLGTYEQRNKVRDYEKYLSENFFFGEAISLVPRLDQDVVYFKQGSKEERPIYDLGDGIQSIIILTFPIFMADKPTMFFIEEPEHYLHAGLQRALIDTYTKHEEHMFFMTTHSNHFIDIAQECNDISIQQVSQVNGFTSILAAQSYGDLLATLGVRASSVLLANCSIWVEGITDKLYLRVYLKKYIQELRDSGNDVRANHLNSYHENLHYVFTEYQGSNITHWHFNDDIETGDVKTPAKRLNRNILLVADADIDSKGNRVTELNKELEDNFLLLQWKEIENFIPQNVIIQTANARWETFNGKDGCSTRFENIPDGAFEKLNDGIGRVLERYVTKPTSTKRRFYSEESGTIKDKVKFCHKAIEIMTSDNSWRLTPELSKLCEKIWTHIDNHNK